MIGKSHRNSFTTLTMQGKTNLICKSIHFSKIFKNSNRDRITPFKIYSINDRSQDNCILNDSILFSKYISYLVHRTLVILIII